MIFGANTVLFGANTEVFRTKLDVFWKIQGYEEHMNPYLENSVEFRHI